MSKTKKAADTYSETDPHGIAQDALINVAEETMLGDLMNCIKEQVKALPKPWQQLSESQQYDYLDRIEQQCRAAVTQAVNIIMSQGKVTVEAIVEQVTFKDGVKVVMKMMKGTTGVHDLADSEGQAVLIIVANTDHLTRENGKPVPDKDQPPLNGFGEGDTSDLEAMDANA